MRPMRVPRVLPHELELLVSDTIGAAVTVHKELGPGFLEGIYRDAMAMELSDRGIRCERELQVPVTYKGRSLRAHRLDLAVERSIVVEVKAVSSLDAAHYAQVLSYLRATKWPVGLLINFANWTLRGSIRRIVL